MEKKLLHKQSRPDDVPSVTRRVEVGCGHLYVTVGIMDDKPFEVFAILGNTGGCAAAQCTALTKSISQGLRYGIPVSEFIKLLRGTKCHSSLWSNGVHILSCPDAIGLVLDRYRDGLGGSMIEGTNDYGRKKAQEE